ncbi:hypothetical protein JCM3775_002105 [Rhodotorula graminis]
MKLRSATAASKPEPADEEMPLAPPDTAPDLDLDSDLNPQAAHTLAPRDTDSAFDLDLDLDLDLDQEAANSSDDYVPPGAASAAKKRKAKKGGDKERSPEMPTPATTASKRKAPKKVKGKAKAKVVERRDGPFPLLELPGELIDLILADDDLHLGSHLALAATCKALRACYYSRRPRSANLYGFHSPQWGALLHVRPFVGEGRPWWRKDDVDVEIPDEPERIVEHLWTREDRISVDKMAVVQGKAAVRAHEWDVAAHKVANQRITKTTAKSAYKLSDAELNALTPQYKQNPHGRSAAPMQLFVEAAVEALAFRLHGGAAGHAALLKKREATRAKSRATRRAKASGTWVSPAKKRRTAVETDEDESSDESAHDEGDEDDDGAASLSLSPSLSPTLTTQRGRASGAGASPSKSVAAALAQLCTASPIKARSSSMPAAAPLALGPAFALQPAAAAAAAAEQGSTGLASVKREDGMDDVGSAVAQQQGLSANPYGDGSPSTSTPVSPELFVPRTPLPHAPSALDSPFLPAATPAADNSPSHPYPHPHEPALAPQPSSLDSATAATASFGPRVPATALSNLTDDERHAVLQLLRGGGGIHGDVGGSGSAVEAGSSSSSPAAAAVRPKLEGQGEHELVGGGEAQQQDVQGEAEGELDAQEGV